MIRTISISLLLALPLVAQNEAQPGAQPVQPGAQPVQPGQPPIAGVQPPAPGGGVISPDPVEPTPRRARPRPPGAPDPNQGGVKLNMANVTGQEIATMYYTFTGLRVLVSSEAAAGELNLQVAGEMTNGQAATLIEKKLVMEGYEMVQDREDPYLMKLVIAASPTNGVRPLGPKVITNLDDYAGSADGFLTYVMDLDYIKPDDALRAFQQVVQNYGTAGTVASVTNAGSVVISANLPLIRMLEELRAKIDVPAAQVATKFVEVTYADVEELATRLNEIFNEQRQSQQNTARLQRVNTSNPTGSTPPIPGNGRIAGAPNNQAGGSAGEDTPIRIVAQSRTSRVFLMGRPVDITFLEGLIEQFDAPSSKRNFLTKKMRYLPVSEFIPVAADALERTLETGTSAGGAGGRRPSTATNRSNNNFGRNQFSNNQQNNQFGAGGNNGGRGGSRAQVAQQNFQTAPESLLIGKTLLVADNIANTIVVNGPPHHIEIVEELVNKLDQPSEQVAITAVFARYDVGDSRSFGVDLARLLSGGDVRGGVQSRNGIPSVIDPNTLFAPPAPGAGPLGALLNAPGTGLSAYTIIGDHFGVFVNALESDRNFRTISRPTIFTTNNGLARISSGSRIAVPTSTFQGNTSGFSTNVEFRDIVLELEVQPLVNSENEVTLDISLVRDNVGEDRTIQGFGDVPDIDTDELSTRVTVPNRSTLVLGGLITETDSRSQSGVPFLSKIPFLGNFLKTSSKNIDREELVILIHPSILNTKKSLQDYQRHYDAGSKMAPEARAAVLPPQGAYHPVTNPIAGSRTAPGRAARAVVVPEKKVQVTTSPTHRALRNRRRR